MKGQFHSIRFLTFFLKLNQFEGNTSNAYQFGSLGFQVVNLILTFIIVI